LTCTGIVGTVKNLIMHDVAIAKHESDGTEIITSGLHSRKFDIQPETKYVVVITKEPRTLSAIASAASIKVDSFLFISKYEDVKDELSDLDTLVENIHINPEKYGYK
jgi:hypothetical protein